jgi:thioredoxin reductase (NADPH)
MESTDVLLIGAGPIGIETAVALRRAGIEHIHVEAGQVGATIHWWAPGTRFFSSPERIAIAGVPLTTLTQDKATREEYLAYLRAVVQQFGLSIRTRERVVLIEPRGEDRGFLVTTKVLGDERRYAAQRVVLAMGDMQRPRLLNIEGEKLPHVSHYLREPHEYFGRRVLIVGGRNSAVEAAIRLHRVGAMVSMSYRRAEFDPERIKYWLLPEIRHLIKTGAIGWHPQTVAREITPAAVILAPAEGGSAFEAAADEVLLLTGYEMDSRLLESAGVELVGEGRAPQYNPRTMETNVPGLYVAGTAAAGTQHRFKYFIENCHVHPEKIVAAIRGGQPPEEPEAPAMPES